MSATHSKHAAGLDPFVKDASCLSKSSTRPTEVDFFALEREGNHFGIIQIQDDHLLERAVLSPRVKAGMARSHAFVGDLQLASQLIHEIRSLPTHKTDRETKTVLLLAEAAILRRTDRWALAKVRALRAMASAKRCEDRSLVSDALFATALALTEDGRSYLALDCYRRVRKDPHAADFRKGLSALNEACILWDQGRWMQIAEILPHIPSLQSTRFKLMLDLVELNHDSIRTLFTAEPPTLSTVENRQILLLLCEYAFLMRARRPVALAGTWLEVAAEELLKEQKDPFWCKSLNALALGSFLNLEDVDTSLDARSKIERYFLVALSCSVESEERTREIYSNFIQPLLVSAEFQTPLIPRLDELHYPWSAWAKVLTLIFTPEVPPSTDGNPR